MKKQISLILMSLLMLTLISGCGSSAGTDTGASANGDTESTVSESAESVPAGSENTSAGDVSEGDISADEINETQEADTAAAEPSPEAAAESSVETTAEPAAETEAEPAVEITTEPAAETTTETSVNSAGLTTDLAESIYAAYLPLLASCGGDTPGYYIYDINKDRIPELLTTYEEGNDRGLAVATYLDGEVRQSGVIWGFAHGLPFPASYPDGNGITLTETARSYECIWVIGIDAGTLNGDVRTDENSVYVEPVDDYIGTYYQNAEDDYSVYINHQYKSETLSPFFEGSRLLGFCSPDDDTALKEALDLE